MKWRLNLDPVQVSGPSGHFADVGSGSGKSHRIQIDIEITKKSIQGGPTLTIFAITNLIIVQKF
jgi:hypothetical protein